MEEEIRKLYHDYWQASVNRDADTLRLLLSDDYELRHMTGTRQSREEFIAAVMDGTLHYYSSDQVAVDVHDDHHMTGKSVVSAAVYGGRRTTWHLLEDFTFKKENGHYVFTGCAVSTF